jgi:hypothetical protein
MGGLVVIILALALAAFIGWVGLMQGYTNGYCAAISGTVISTSLCNVNGQIVLVVK